MENWFYGRFPSNAETIIHGVIASGGVTAGVEPPRLAELERLEAEELRLLAAAIGDHLPVELAERVEGLRRRRQALKLLWEPA